MRPSRIFLLAAAVAAFFMAGVLVAWTQTGEPTVETRTFTHEDVVTFTVPTETEITTTVVTETVISTETVTTTMPGTTTEPPTTTTEPDPDPPTGTTVNLLNERFICTGPLAELGQLPIIVEQHLSNDHPSARAARGAVAIESGCTGDGDPATDDLVIHQYGNGTTLGAGGDPIVIFPGSHDLTITGFTDCGTIYVGADGVPRTSDDAHQDGFDIRGGMDILIHDYRMGDWASQTATCHGAGGLYYPSAFLNSNTPKDDPALLQRVLCVRCLIVAGKVGDPSAGPGGRAGFIVQSIDSGAIDSCFLGFIAFQIRHDTPTVRGAIRPVDEGNVKVDRDGPSPDAPNTPDDCEL